MAEELRAQPVRVFMSYSRRDEAAVARLVRALEADGSIEVLRDKEDILPAEDWRDRLLALIREAHAFVLCLTPEAAVSVEVGREIDEAVKGRKRIVPVVLCDTPNERVREEIRRLNFVFLRSQDPLEAGVTALRAAVQTDIASVREHTRLGELAQRWKAEGRRSSDELRGPGLEAAERWLAGRSREAPEPTALHIEYVTSSRRGATRRLRVGAAGAAVVALVTTVLAFVARWQRNEAQTQRTAADAGRLVAEAEAILANPVADGDVATRKLLASLALHPTEQAEKALARAVTRLEPVAIAALDWEAGKAPRALRFSPNGTYVVVVTEGAIQLWSATGRLAWQGPIAAGEAHTLFAPDERHVLIATGDEKSSSDLELTLLDLTSEPVTAARLELEHVRDAASVTKRLLVLSEGPGELTVRDAVTRETVWRAAIAGPLQGARLARRAGAQTGEGDPDVVVVGTEGQVRAWRLDAVEMAPAPPLPAGSSLLVIGETGRALAIRRADGQQAVLDTLTGREKWHGGPGIDKPLALLGGDRFVVTQGPQGVALQSLDGGMGVNLEAARRTDWDLTALSDVQRYSTTIDAQVSDDGAIVAMAWNDGRVDLWSPTLKPRYGAIGGMPLPSFESLARFDHGEQLGAVNTWAAPPSLFLSPSGRFAASQSLGMATNAVGGVLGVHPKLRVWDAHTGGEIARFARLAAMGIAFSPRDDVAVTVSLGPHEGKGRLEFWRLGAGQANVAREEISLTLRGAPPGGTDAGSAPAPTPDQSPMSLPGLTAPSPTAMLLGQSPSTERVWVGIDRKLRVLDLQQRAVVVLDDLTPAFDEVRTKQRDVLTNLLARQDLDDREREGIQGTLATLQRFDESGLSPDSPMTAPLPLPAIDASGDLAALPLPLAAIGVSGDGRRVAVEIGSWLYVYAIDERRRLAAFDCGNYAGLIPGFDIAGELVRQAPVLSHDGRFAAISRIDVLPLLRGMLAFRADLSTPVTIRRDIAVIALEGQDPSTAPIANVSADIDIEPLQTPLGPVITASRPLALSRDGALLALEQRELVKVTAQPPRREGRLLVIEARTGRHLLERPPELLPSPLDFDALSSAVPWAAAFSPSGQRLVSEQTRSPCPTRVMTTAALMPMNVPSCPELATRLTWWDLDHGAILGAVGYERTAPAATPQKLAPPRRPASLAMSSEEEVERVVVEWTASPCDTAQCTEVRATDEHVSLDHQHQLVEEACERLAPPLREIGADEWRQSLLGETPRAICPVRAGSTASSSG